MENTIQAPSFVVGDYDVWFATTSKFLQICRITHSCDECGNDYDDLEFVEQFDLLDNKTQTIHSFIQFTKAIKQYKEIDCTDYQMLYQTVLRFVGLIN